MLRCGHSGERESVGVTADAPSRLDEPVPYADASIPRRDRAGFTRRWGINGRWVSGAPWVSLGVHLDWHTPTVDIYFGQGAFQIGRNQHDFEGRVSFSRLQGSGHTDQCLCERDG